MRQLIIFDWDHTLAVPESGNTFRRPGERYVWARDDMPDILEWLKADWEISIATNQGGIAFGIIRQDETERAIFALLKQLSFPIPVLISPYHEQRPDLYRELWHFRKPNSGMYSTLHMLYPDVEDEHILVVGDRDEDAEAARRLGFAYRTASEFFAEVAEEIEDAESSDVEPPAEPITGEPPDEIELMYPGEYDDEAPF